MTTVKYKISEGSIPSLSALLDRTARDVKMSYQLLREKQLQYLQFHSLD